MTSSSTERQERHLTEGEAELIATSKANEVPCPLCNSQNYDFYCNAPSHYTPETYRVTKCNDCGMVFTNPQFTFYDKVAENRGATPGLFENYCHSSLVTYPGRRFSILGAEGGHL
jgi:hypothetical protein